MTEQARFILERGTNGETLRVEPATGNTWVLVHRKRGEMRHGVEHVIEDYYYWEPVFEGDPAKPAEEAKRPEE